MEDNEKYDRIEGRLDDMDERLREVEINAASYQEITNRNTEVLEKFNDTMVSMKDTMIDISYSTKKNTEVTNKLTQEVGALNDKVDKVDDKGKLDTTLFLKDNWRGWIEGGGVVFIATCLYQMIVH